VLLATRLVVNRWGGLPVPLVLMVMSIAAIAAVRYSLAAYDLGRRRA
jgi:hypothetical protein